MSDPHACWFPRCREEGRCCSPLGDCTSTGDSLDALVFRLRAEAEGTQQRDVPGVSTALMQVYPADLLRVLDALAAAGGEARE